MAVSGEQLPAETPSRHHSDPCQHAYAKYRARLFAAVTNPAMRVVLLILDVPARWLMNLSDTVIGNRGYFTVGSVLAVYFAVFGLIDAKSTQEETRASVERSLFMTLVSSGNGASFVVAMKDFGPIQTMEVTAHPSWFKFWGWGRTYQPNQQPMHDWAGARFDLCKKEVKDCSVGDGARIDLKYTRLDGAQLRYVDLHAADLTGAHLSGAHLNNANLSGARLSDADLNSAHLNSANLSGADVHDARLYQADLSGADLRGAKGLSQEDQLAFACGDKKTLFDPGLTIKPCPKNRPN